MMPSGSGKPGSRLHLRPRPSMRSIVQSMDSAEWLIQRSHFFLSMR